MLGRTKVSPHVKTCLLLVMPRAPEPASTDIYDIVLVCQPSLLLLRVVVGLAVRDRWLIATQHVRAQEQARPYIMIYAETQSPWDAYD